MNNDWRTFLTSQGAHIDETGVSHFADNPTTANPSCDGICDLSHLGLLRFSGEDARDFLQGQLSNDVNLLEGTHNQLSSYCTPKGRILASFRLFQHDDAFYMLLPADTLAATQKRLQMYIMMSKVTIDDLSDDTVRIGISTTAAEKLADLIPGSLPTQPDAYVHHDGLHILRVGQACQRYILIGSPDTLQPLWQTAADILPVCGYNTWHYRDIEDGIPAIVAANVEAFVPQMVNLHAINGVSFSKGCYPGQEIVARMHFLGKLKRRMYRATVKTQDAPKPGDPLFSAQSTSGQGAGQIVISAPLANDHYALLAVIQISAEESGPIHLHNETGPALHIEALPYTVPLEREK